MTTPLKWGSEFLVNAFVTPLDQIDPVVAALPDGRFLAVWKSEGDSRAGIPFAIMAQIFDADGTAPPGGSFRIDAPGSTLSGNPDIAVLADGNVVVTWTATFAAGGDLSGSAVHARRFTADGSPLGAEFQVNTTVASIQFQPTITALADGRFVVAWTDFSLTGGETSGYAIRAQVFNADGSAIGLEFLVNTTVANDQSDPTITALADGRFVVAWRDDSQTGGDTTLAAIRAQVFNADGSTFGGEFLVNTTVTSSQTQPTITALADGRFVVAWTDFSATGGDPSGFAIRAQVFNADGSTSGTEFLVNTTVTGFQSEASITALADGRFVVAWMDFSLTGGDTSNAAIRAQVFNADGSKSGSEFLVNTTVADNQYEPTITALADGRFVVAWRDASSSTDDDIRGQIFDPREGPVTLNGTLADDDFVGTLFADLIGGSFGDDRLSGAGGDDRLGGGFGDDTLTGDAGNDQLDGGDGNDRLIGNAGSDVLDGGAGNDILNGGVGSDALIGGSGNDLYLVDAVGDLVIEAQASGTDEVRSATITIDLLLHVNVENATLLGTASLEIIGGAGANKLVGNSGSNAIDGDAGNDVIYGGNGIDILVGNLGNDRLFGGTGNDYVFSGAGADTVQGGTGQDLLQGDAGADVFVFASAAEAGVGVNRDRITDLSAGVDDLDFSAFMAGGSFIGAAQFTIGGGPQVRFVVATGILLGDVTGDGVTDFSLQLDGGPVLTAADVVF